MKLSTITIAASVLLSTASALAHDARPAYLELVETDAAVFEQSFGPDFGAQLLTAPLGEWYGPVESANALALERLTQRYQILEGDS
jgi:hypothetical protein